MPRSDAKFGVFKRQCWVPPVKERSPVGAVCQGRRPGENVQEFPPFLPGDYALVRPRPGKKGTGDVIGNLDRSYEGLIPLFVCLNSQDLV